MKLIRSTLIAAAVCVALAGCGNGDDELTDVSSQSQSTDQSSQGSQDADALNRASGEVAEVSGSTAQVQGDSTQVAVTWTDATTFTAEQPGSLADVVVGACVLVATEESTDADAAAATSVRVLGTDGDCAMPGGPGGSGERPTDLPSGLPQPGDGATPPADGPAPDGQRPGGGRGQIGEVTAVSADGFTVTSSMPGVPGGEIDSNADAEGGTAEARELSVSVTEATTFSITAAADAAAVTVGSCLSADGERSGTGTLTATAVAITQQVEGECRTGFGRGRAGAAPGAARGSDS